LNAAFGKKLGLEDQHALGGGGYSYLPKTSLCLNAGRMGRQDYETETLIGGYFDGADGSTQAIAFAENSRGEVRLEGGDGQRTGAISHGGGKPGQGYPAVVGKVGVRRLTPTECERLQGFSDGHTLVIHRGRAAADGPRYKALGNSMAVPVMRWIGKRIAEVERILVS
jgi:DNA (cytosine-5)-methyltransferase 1